MRNSFSTYILAKAHPPCSAVSLWHLTYLLL